MLMTVTRKNLIHEQLWSMMTLWDWLKCPLAWKMKSVPAIWLVSRPVAWTKIGRVWSWKIMIHIAIMMVMRNGMSEYIFSFFIGCCLE